MRRHLPIKSNIIFDPSTFVIFADVPPNDCHPESNRTAGSALSTLTTPDTGSDSKGRYWILSNKKARPVELTLTVNSCRPWLISLWSHRRKFVARMEVSIVRGLTGMLSTKHCHCGSVLVPSFSLLAVPYNRTPSPSEPQMLVRGKVREKQHGNSSYLRR